MPPLFGLQRLVADVLNQNNHVDHNQHQPRNLSSTRTLLSPRQSQSHLIEELLDAENEGDLNPTTNTGAACQIFCNLKQ